MSDSKTSKAKPAFTLYSVTGEGEKAFWSRIGAAWPHKDGNGYSIKLESFPLNGRLQMRSESASEGGAQ